MSSTVSAAARALGTSPAHVRSMIRRGDLPARNEGGRYLVEVSDLSGAALLPPVRPMRVRMLTPLLDVLDGHPVADQALSPVLRHRLDEHLGALRSTERPEALLAAWSASRYRRVLRIPAPTTDVTRAAGDPRVRLGGVSDPRSQVVARTGELYGWLFTEEPGQFLRDHFLVEGLGATIVLTLTGEPMPDGPVPLSWVMCDLARLPGVRERGRAGDMIREALRTAA